MVVDARLGPADLLAGRPPVAGDRGCWAKERFCHSAVVRRNRERTPRRSPPARHISWRSPASRCWRSGCTRRSWTPPPEPPPTDASVLDLGVQDTGPDGARWALELRGLGARPRRPVHRVDAARGAPRLPPLAGGRGRPGRGPWSEADAAKRVFDASRPLEAGGDPGARRTRPDRRGDARHRGAPRGQGRDVDRAAPAAARALPAVVPGVRGRAPLRAAVPAGGAPGRPRAPAGHLSPGPPAPHRLARAGQADRSRRSTSSGACCGSWGRRRRSRWRSTSTPRSRT